MEWNSAISNHPDLSKALLSCTETLEITTENEPDVIFVFVSPHHRDHWRVIGPMIQQSFPNARIIGSSGWGIVGAGHEVEGQPALSLTAAFLPGVTITPFRLEADDEDRPTSAASWLERLQQPEHPECLLLLPDPFTMDSEAICAELDRAFPSTTVVGGLSSGGQSGETALFMDGRCFRGGLVGVAFTGNVSVKTIVGQGCRPVGTPYFVTSAEDQTIRTLDGRPALDVLVDACRELDAADLSLARQALLIGFSLGPQEETFENAGTLIRNIVGAIPEERSIMVAGRPQLHDIVQFQVRDARSAWEDLNTQLERVASDERSPMGGLMFTCIARGQNLFGESGHDSRLVAQHFGNMAIGGFFCNGELGPVGGRTWVHAQTTALVLFQPGSDA